MTVSSERLVLRYLAHTQQRQVKTTTTIEVACRDYWALQGIHRSGSTYRRAWHRLMQSGAVATVGLPVRDHGALVHVLAWPVTDADVAACPPAVHGGAV